MAKITTITNPLTGQPAQVDQLDHTAQQIDDGIGFESTAYPGCYYRTVGGVVEWVNPPMQVGGIDADGNLINEYRTTERYLGKPVYAMLVDCKEMPNASTKKVDHKIPNIQYIVEVKGSLYKTDGSEARSLPYWFSTVDYAEIRADKTSIYTITAGGQWETRKCYAVLKYTKTTD